MKFYLSSFKLGNKPSDFVSLLDKKKRIAYISNALDHLMPDRDAWRKDFTDNDKQGLQKLGLNVSDFDLQDYFGRTQALRKELSSFSGVWISGGNVFVLRQAMRLSGFDLLIQSNRLGDNFIYGAYSAGSCVLSPRLTAYQEASDPKAMPYPEIQNTIWDGLNKLDFVFMPHYKSQHSESDKISTEIAYCLKHQIRYKTFCDGEVFIC